MEQILNILNNRQLYKKAYLIEFYDQDSNKPADVFTFSVPPESEELTYPQRKTETKTFGGLHVDEYGTHEVKISLSGSTINQSLKRIYKGGFGKDQYLSGEAEIYHFRDLILKYKSVDQLKDNKNAKVIIYDLSKFSMLRLGTIDNYWQAFLGDFKIRRASDRPFCYKYTLEFTGVPPYSTKYSLGFDSKILDKLLKILNALKAVLNFMNQIEGLIDDVLGYVRLVSDLLNLLGDIMTYPSNIISSIMTSIGDVTVGLIDGTTSIVGGVNSIVSLPRTVQLKALSIGLDIQNATNRLVQASDALSASCHGLFDSEYYKIPQEVLRQYGLEDEEFKDQITDSLNEIESLAGELATFAKSSEIPDVTVGNPNPETGEPQVVLSYGHTSVMLRDTDSLESLAAKYMGSPDRAIDIASFNGVASLSDLKPGDVVRIPITKRTGKMTNNLIFARREDRDNYGRDIMLTDEGYIVASNTGDYELTSGVNNLSQGTLLRLKESNAKRIRINTYGIRNNISDPTAGIAYIISSIKLTVENDPRVAAVDDIRFKGIGDSLDVQVFYHDINNADGKTAGRI